MRTATELLQRISNDDLLGLKSDKRNCLTGVLDFLRSNIPRKVYARNKRDEYISIWQWVGDVFQKQNRFHEANAVFGSLYQELTSAQIEGYCYIPKGTPLVLIHDNRVKLNQPWLAHRFMIYTIIEDAISFRGKINPNKVGSYSRAVSFHNINDRIFNLLAKKAYGIYTSNRYMGKFPEWVFLNLMETTIGSCIPVRYPSNDEKEISPINQPFARFWFDKILSEKRKRGSSLEDFSAYLLWCMPGFEVQRRVPAQDSHFDALVRNKSNASDFRSDLGNYILSESKNWSNPIGPQEIAYFAAKLLFHDVRSGVIFSQKGITGEGEAKNAALTLLKSFYKIGRIIMIINKKDINEAVERRGLVSLFQSKYESTKFTL